MPEGTLQLEHLQQATKLLQLKKATIADIEIIFDICWMLTPTQIQKLINVHFSLCPRLMTAILHRRL
jgi:myosin-5